jgi:GT2 family glycosyltransferase
VSTDRPKDPSQLSGPPVRETRRSYVEDQYPTLVRNNRLRASDLRRVRHEAANLGYRPLVSIVMPVLDRSGGLLERTLDSVLGQVYAHWELRVCGDASVGKPTNRILSRYECLDGRVKVAYAEPEGSVAGLVGGTLSLISGEFVCVMGQEDELAPDALLEVVRLLQEHPETDVVYSDEDDIDDGGVRSHPRFKPGWSPDLLLSDDYVSGLSVYRKSIVEKAGGLAREGFDGYEGYDLILRVAERTSEIRHVPRVLYHRRTAASGPQSLTGGGARAGARRALSEALRRRGIEGSVEDGLLPGHLRAKAKVEGRPKVSLIVPTRDNVSLLKNCIESVERQTTYGNYEILIVDNDSADRETVEYLASTPHRVVPFREPFNYSRINNFAVSLAEGDYVVLLNDDTEVISDGWLEAMLEHAQRPEVGAVGAKLVYPDGRIQHAGVLVGVGGAWSPGVATHSHQFYPSTYPGYLGAVARVTNYSAVTAACMMLRKSLFEEIEGLDEENLKVSFNDVDLCLRLRERGYSVVYTPYAELYHHESVSRGYKGDPSEVLYMREHWGETLDDEPFYNPHFSRGSGDYNLRADMLRPRMLQPENRHSRTVSADSFEKALVSGAGGLRGYIRAQQRVARDSHRVSLAPAHAGKTGKTIELPLREEPGPDVTAVLPGDGRNEAPLGSMNRLPVEASGRRGLHAEQLIWMFGSPRTGSTWLSWMMAELEGQERWHEPYVGLLFGSFVYERLGNIT